MALQFICGTSGTGKTAWCCNHMKESAREGRPAFLIVPEQVSLTMENRAIEELGYLGAGREVLSFGRLFHRIYQLCDGRKRRCIDKIGKTMLLNRVLTEQSDALTVYQSAAKSARLAGELLSTISEFKRHGVPFEELKEQLPLIPQPSVAMKLTDIALLYEEYEKKVAAAGADSEDNLVLLKKMIPPCPLMQDADIFIDCFSGFTPQEFGVVEAMIRTCRNVFVTLNTDNSSSPVFYHPNNAKQKLMTLAEEVEILPDVLLKEDVRHQSPELKFLERQIGRYPFATYPDPTNDLRLFVSDNPYHEIDQCARDIVRLVREEHYRFGEIALVTGDTETYGPIIRSSFSKHGIAYFLDQKRGILNHPVSLFLLSLCDLFIHSFSYESVFSFLKTRLSGIPQEQVDRLENYVLLTGIRGSAWTQETDWTYQLSDEEGKDINQGRRALTALVMPFRQETKGRHKAAVFVQAMKHFMEQVHLAEQIENLTKVLTAKGGLDLALEYRQVYNLMISVLDQLEACMGELSFGIEKFRDMLASGLGQCEIGIIPPSCDRVACGSFDRSKHHDIRALYIVGACDGIFPPLLTGTGILTDADRRLLEKNGIEIAPDTKKKAMEQPFLTYEILSSPSDYLVLSYPLSNRKGESARPSHTINAVRNLFPYLAVSDALSPSPETLISSPAATLSCMMSQKEQNGVWQEVKSWYRQQPDLREKLQFVLSAKSYRLSAKVAEETARLLWGTRLNSTVTRLESFAQCPFSYFLQYGLQLKERKEYSFSAPDAGTLIHKLMEEFTSSVIGENRPWESLKEEWCTQRVRELTEKFVLEQTASMPQVTTRHRFLMERLQQAASSAIWAVVRHIQAGVFKPYAVEFSFDDQAGIPPIELETDQGNQMVLYGKIDRIDTGEGLFRIIDYKSGAYDLDLSKVYQGVTLQLFVYTAALKNKLGDPAGMFYLTVDTPLVEANGQEPPEELKERAMKELKLKGYLVGEDAEVVLKMDKNITGYSEVVSARATSKGITSTRLLSPDDYDALTQTVLHTVSQYGDRIFAGDCAISPLSEGQTNACTYCPYNAVCGFEPSCRRRVLKPMTNQDVLEALHEKEVQQ